jgi:hypothetical protein
MKNNLVELEREYFTVVQRNPGKQGKPGRVISKEGFCLSRQEAEQAVEEIKQQFPDNPLEVHIEPESRWASIVCAIKDQVR